MDKRIRVHLRARADAAARRLAAGAEHTPAGALYPTPLPSEHLFQEIGRPGRGIGPDLLLLLP